MYVTIGGNGMERMTCSINGYPHGKCGKNLETAIKQDRYNRDEFECTAIVERLYEYENTGLTPEQIIQMKRENIKLNKQNEEIQNSNIEYYNRAKDAEDRCKKIEQQNERLKELLKMAIGEIYKISELNEDVCFMECDSCNDCSFVCDETGICKWK